MTLKLRVTWRNASSPLLPDALTEIQAVAGGSPLPLTGRSPGVREFAVPAGAARVELKAQFSAAFGAVGSHPATKQVVLEIEQPYDVTGDGKALTPAANSAFAGGHPLVSAPAGGAAGVAVAELCTDFVDITPLWMACAENSDEYQRDHQPGTELAVLGFTAGDPKIWFASVPLACGARSGAELPAIVFFRPESYPYSRVDEKQDMFGLNRYLLKPSSAPDIDYWARDVFAKDPDKGARWFWLRCGFEDALARSGRAVVMLHPWPSGSSFGKAIAPGLGEIAERALRFLQASGKIAAGPGRVRLGRLGLAGFSAGGLSLWPALASNAARVTEVFSFDARGVAANEKGIVQWFNGDPARTLRMAGGYQISANEGVRRAIALAGGTPGERFTSFPPDEKAYLPGANPLWDHACSDLSAEEHASYVGSGAVWHQFTVFGGFPAAPGPEATTFLQRFLEESGM